MFSHLCQRQAELPGCVKAPEKGMEQYNMKSREEKECRGKVLWKIFLSTLYLSAFTFGGGYVIVTLMKKKFVDEFHWIEEKEMLDLLAAALCDHSANICLLQCVPQ